MFAVPTAILRLWLLALLPLGIIAGSAALAHEWYRRAWSYDWERRLSYFDPHWGWNGETLLLAGAVALLLWTLCGGLLARGIVSLLGGGKGGGEALPTGAARQAGTVREIARPDGSTLCVEISGPEDAPPIVLTHGWGADRTEWDYLRRDLGGRFRLIAWDLPGLGRSTRPANRDYSLENLARDLEAVLALAGEGRRAVLLGHSIGGMITLTFCRLFPEALGPRVAGLALVHTTYTDPVRTTSGAALMTVLEKPVLTPLMYLTVALSPVLWALTWLSYLNGTARQSAKGGFAGTETPAQVDFVARWTPRASPAVLARGMLGMMRYDASATLGTIPVPTLVVPGDKDSTCLPGASEHMRASVPGARLTALAPAKHMGLIEHPERFAELVREFVGECAEEGRG